MSSFENSLHLLSFLTTMNDMPQVLSPVDLDQEVKNR